MIPFKYFDKSYLDSHSDRFSRGKVELLRRR